MVRRPAPISVRFLGSELRLIFGRRRNWVGLAVLAAVPIVLAIAVKATVDNAAGGDQGGPNFINLIAGNGLFVAIAALGIELGLFLPLAVAAIAGDAVAGEANVGTLRYLLVTPVNRTRLLAVKYAAIVIFGAAATLLVAVVGVLIGLALFGGGDVLTLSGSQLSFGAGLWRLLLICGYLTAGFAALGAIGLFVSTLTEQPIGATIAVVILNVLSFILDNIPQLGWLHPYLPTHYWTAFADLLRDPMEFGAVGHGLLSAAAYAVVFCSLAWARFAGKDVTS